MRTPILHRLLSPAVLLGLFLVDLFLVLGMLVNRQSPPLLVVAVVCLGALGLLLTNRMALRSREANFALEEGERYIETVADLSQDIHAVLGAEDRSFVYLNAAMEKLLGYPAEDFLKGGLVYLESLMHPDDLEEMRQQWQALLASAVPDGSPEEVRQSTCRLRDHKGEWRWLEFRCVVFNRHSDGKPRQVLVVGQDVTEHRLCETALINSQKFENLGVMAGSIAHDLNNVLMGIQGYAEMAKDQGDLGACLESLEKIQESTQRASGLCRQMMAFAARGRVQIQPQRLNDLVKECLPLVEGLLPEGVHLALDLAPELPVVKADAGQLRHALLSLVMNAADAIQGAGELRIRTRQRRLEDGGEAQKASTPELAPGDYVCLDVEDTGQGMSEETLNRIFDPTFSTKVPGRGLGLPTVLGIVRGHHGGIRVESRLGAGSRFSLLFPTAAARPDFDEGDEGTLASASAGVILLVDDEPLIRAVLKQGLEKIGFRVLEAADGVEGFGSFVRHRAAISAVLLDLTMPRMGGDEVLHEIHRLAPEMPVILMSGYAEGQVLADLADKGLAGFLPKPCSVKEAQAAVRKALGIPEEGA